MARLAALVVFCPFGWDCFLMLGQACLFPVWRGPPGPAWARLVWTGLEFFRSELLLPALPSWLNPVTPFQIREALHHLAAYGVYGIGFLLMAVVSVVSLPWNGCAELDLLCLTVAALYPALLPTPALSRRILAGSAGVQLESPAPPR